MIEIKAVWTGWAGGPGYSTFHGGGGDAASAQNLYNAVYTFFDAISNLVPSSITVTVVPTYRVLDAASGSLISQGNVGAPSAGIVGTGNAAFAALVGMCVNWQTGVSAGKKLRVGRTYLIPLTAFIWATDGTVNDSVVTQVLGAATTYAATSDAQPVVWKRPRNGAGGVVSPITGARVPDEGVVMRSRRQ